MSKHYLGIDIGSTTLKAVVIDEKAKILHELYERTKPTQSRPANCSGRCAECGACSMGALKNTIDAFLAKAGITRSELISTAVTGSQIVDDTGEAVPYDVYVSEVSAHVAGAKLQYPDCNAILDVGGQDSKAMLFNEDMDMWTSKMSGICAAGTGAFLDSVAVKLGIPVEEMDSLADLETDLEFSSVCAVLSATSINKFKSRYPIGQIIGGACKAQARTIISGVGDLLLNYKGDILFQGGVAYNRAVAHFLQLITGSNIIIPEHHSVMGAVGAALLARERAELEDELTDEFKMSGLEGLSTLKSVGLRARTTRRDFLGKNGDKPLVWRNLFFPPEILNAMGVRMMTLETYAALFARNRRKVNECLDQAAYKGFSAETCSFLRILEGMELPRPVFAASTSQPCQQGERIFQDLVRSSGLPEENFFSLHTPISNEENSVEHMASDLERAVARMEKAVGRKMDAGELARACDLSNEARSTAIKSNLLRLTSPPLIRGGVAVYFANMFSQLWGRPEMVELQELFHQDLLERREKIGDTVKVEDTHRLVWLHLPPFYDSKLLDHIEITCNAPIIFEEVNFVDWEPLDPSDPYRSLARKLLTTGFLDSKQRVKHLRDHSPLVGVNGCVLYNHMFGRCSMADTAFVKYLREELRKVGVPVLVLDGDCIDPTIDPCSTYTKVSAFVEALNRHKYGNIFGPTKRKEARR